MGLQELAPVVLDGASTFAQLKGWIPVIGFIGIVAVVWTWSKVGPKGGIPLLIGVAIGIFYLSNPVRAGYIGGVIIETIFP